ncbi:nitroreductase family protein [Rosistilla oblonga]|nr:nitroreductase family protein [Rosistilla oblonga]
MRYRITLPFYRRVMWPVALRIPFVTAIYFCFFDKSFWQEFQSTLAGKVTHYERNASGEGNSFLLRRNVHRLEKGLIMRPRRDLFATDYVGQTVDCLKALSFEEDPQLWKWAFDVLTEFFNATHESRKTDKARQAFQQLAFNNPRGIVSTEERFIPSRASKHSEISWEDFRQLAIDRRSVRWFSKEKVDRADVCKAMDIALLSPSACNRQPFKYLVFDDPKLIQAVATIPQGTVGFAHNFQMLVAIVGQLDAYALERDRHVIYIDGALSAMSFMFALETLGLSSCPINWPDSGENDLLMRKRFGLKAYERTVMLIAVGHHDCNGMVPRSTKKTPTQVAEFNRPLLTNDTFEAYPA